MENDLVNKPNHYVGDLGLLEVEVVIITFYQNKICSIQLVVP